MSVPRSCAGMEARPRAPWVLLRGLGREARHWGALPDLLVQALPAHAILCPDLPGNGVRNHEPSPTRIEAMVEDCRARLKGGGHLPPYHLLALSLGGMVAASWAASHPHEIAALVLINTSMRPFSPFYERLRPACYAQMLRAAAASDNLPRREALILGLVSNHAARRDAALPAWVALARQNPVSRRNAMRQLLAAARFRASAAAPAAPALVLVSQKDRLVAASCSQALARAWGTALAVHPVAGHDLPLDDAPWVVSEVAAWRKRRGAG